MSFENDNGRAIGTDSLRNCLENGDFQTVLKSPLARNLLGYEKLPSDSSAEDKGAGIDWPNFISLRASDIIESTHVDSVSSLPEELYLIGNAAFRAFVQANVTGPPLPWSSTDLMFPQWLIDKAGDLKQLRRQLISSLSVDGESAYQLTPNVELFCLAKSLLNHRVIFQEHEDRVWGRLRINFWHQRMLSENAPQLQKQIYADLDYLQFKLSSQDPARRAKFLVERANIHIHHGFDTKARDDLLHAARLRGFDFALTGRLGKRTKFQDKELSQLVVLAKSAEDGIAYKPSVDSKSLNDVAKDSPSEISAPSTKPQDLDLNDDTLLESISFSKTSAELLAYQDQDRIPHSLASLDPANQPTLQPLDSIILLALASSITKTSPQDGLSREETLPYATRVLLGGSTNWQVYTQALLVRSRMEGYRSRTVERGVLQLQAVVDQVIADTTPIGPTQEPSTSDTSRIATSTTFLPRPKTSESAPVPERLLYIHQLASPTRWELEAELASRWVSLGGLRTALEIYQRLEMWAEVALCWAANDREDKARRILRHQLYAHQPVVSEDEPSEKIATADEQDDTELDPLPVDAPRLFCILGDLDKSPAAYERAWEVSGNRYARAQRSLGKLWFARGGLSKADEAYVKALRMNPQNHPTWFALGCVRLQLEDWAGAVDAFGRAVQIEEQDAESWSNLAAALLRLPAEEFPNEPEDQASNSKATSGALSDMAGQERPATDSQKHTREAFIALKQAATLKRDSYRIWQNLLNVSIKLSPPPYADIIVAQTRLIDLRSKTEGEGCIDIDVTEGLLAHLIASSPQAGETTNEPKEEIPAPDGRPRRPGISKMITDLIQNRIVPLITTSRRLWLLSAKLSLHLQHPSAALSAYEKAWRVTLNKPRWESGSKETGPLWKEVVDATVELVDAYGSLGERNRESGLGDGELVCRDWRFKARSAVRSVMGRGKGGWEDGEGWEVLEGSMRELKGV